jgi:hypothetical protein
MTVLFWATVVAFMVLTGYMVGVLGQAVHDAAYRRDRLNCVRWNRRPGNPTGHWKGRYFDHQRTPSGWGRRAVTRLAARLGR